MSAAGAGTVREGEFVRSLERGLSVIRAFNAEHPELTLSGVARITGLTRAAARRFLHTLVDLGYMRSEGNKFALRPKILELGYAYLSSLSLPEVAMPHLEQLVEKVHESSSVCVLDGDEVVYVARVPTKRIMTVAISVGTRFPAYATSMGRVLLAAQGDEWLNGYFASVKLRMLTPHTIADPAALRAELQRIGAQGWALAVHRRADPRQRGARDRRDERVHAHQQAHPQRRGGHVPRAAAPHRPPDRGRPVQFRCAADPPAAVVARVPRPGEPGAAARRRRALPLGGVRGDPVGWCSCGQ